MRYRPRHVELAQYVDDTALVATYLSPSLLVGFWRPFSVNLSNGFAIAINVSKSTAVFFEKTERRIQKPRPVQILGEPVKWAEKARYLAVSLVTQLAWSAHVTQIGRKAA
jgi:hypothetical protein